MLINKLEKTIKIPIRVVNGKVRYFYGGELPLIKDGAMGDLIIPEYTVKDKQFIQISQREEKIEIIHQNSILMVAVSNRNIPDDIKQFTRKIDTSVFNTDLYVEIKLLESLKLQFRGSKKSNLLGIKCDIPSLKKKATSINNAYTMISEAFEPDRKCHTGNVFDKCFYKEQDNIWYPLDYLRENVQSEFEGNMFLDYKKFALKNNDFKSVDVNNSALLLIGYLHEYKRISGSEIKNLYSGKINKCIDVVNELLDKEIIREIKE